MNVELILSFLNFTIFKGNNSNIVYEWNIRFLLLYG
jgi:hypothetical protein